MGSPTRAQAPLPRRLPCAGLRVWWAEGAAPVAHPLAVVPGVHELSPGFFAVAPLAGDAAVFDTALHLASSLAETAGEPTELRALVFPAEIRVSGRSVEAVSDFLVRDLEAAAPELTAPGVYLTSRAAKMLEHPQELITGGEYRGPSGKVLPLVLAAGRQLDTLPWRNRELFERRSEFAPRPELDAELTELARAPSAAVAGPLGCGKTRLVWEHLARGESTFLWMRARSERAPEPSLGVQILAQILDPTSSQRADPRHPASLGDAFDDATRTRLASWRESTGLGEAEALAGMVELIVDRVFGRGRRPLTLVCDDAHQATREDSRFLLQLRQLPHLGSRFRLLVIGRRGPGWGKELDALPTLEVPPLRAEQMRRLADRVTAGLSLPSEVEERIVAASGGHPLAFEEGLLSLIHNRSLRRIYGSFFFGGDPSAGFLPSARLVRHVEAEVSRLGPGLPVQLLAAVRIPVPASELSAACSLLGEASGPGWEEPLLAAGLLTAAGSPWGPGLEFACPGYAAAFRHTLPDEIEGGMRKRLGELLAARGGRGEAQWSAYQLLAGSPEAVEPLLGAARSSFAAQIPREELLHALGEELHLLRGRGGNPKLELELLWRLLPLARRMGRLNQFAEDLSRGVDLATSEPSQLLALASLKAELDREAGRFQEAEATIQRALKAAAGGDQRRQGLLLIQLGRLFMRRSRFREARELFHNLETAMHRSGSSALAATCRFFLGNIALRQGRPTAAREHHEAALEERRRQNLLRPVGSSLSALGAVAIALGNYPLAIDYYSQARELLEQHGREGEESFALLGLARALARLGDYTGASQPVRRALALRVGRDDVAGEALARLAVAENFLDLGQPERSLEEARKAHFQLSMLSADLQLAEAEETLGKIRFRQRKLKDAKRHFSAALITRKQEADPLATGLCVAWLLETCIALEDAPGVQQQAADLKEIVTRLGDHDLIDILNFRLFRGLDWLSRAGHKVGDPLPFLRRAYEKVLSKAAHLDPEQRHRFLFQIPESQGILEAATRYGLPAGGS